MRALVFLMAFLAGPPALAGDGPKFELGGIWECTARHDTARPGERIVVIVTGTASRRTLGTRVALQDDETVISTAVRDLDPNACQSASFGSHLAFTEESLRRCAPRFIGHWDGAVTDANKQNWLRARALWLQKMAFDRGAVLDLTPSETFSLIRRTTAACRFG